MNIKKMKTQTMCASLTCTILASSLLPAFATEAIVTETPMDETVEDTGWTVDEESFEDVEVTYQQSASYFVTIPKTIALGTNKQAVYSVKVSGSIDTNQRVYVTPVDGISETSNIDFYMKEQSNKKEDVVATVTQNKFYWNSEDVADGYEQTNNSVSAPDIVAGTWRGTFQMKINLQSEKPHEHNYVDGVCTECGEEAPHEHNYIDGKCECGEIDPNHEHNYEDGECIICGEKQSYDIAPVEAYSNWNYTLDDENDTITLNYYTGSETDVIVYGNYPVENKTYKTKLASNDVFDTNSKKPYMFNAYAQENCKNITSVVFSDLIDTSNVTNMNMMFKYCFALTSVDISCFDTSNVTAIYQMFCNCSSLISADLSNFNTSNVTNMKEVFSGCESLTSVNVSNFDTSKVTTMIGMFAWCSSLTNLDLTSFNTSKVTYMWAMFSDAKKLSKIYVTRGKWVTTQAQVDRMFEDCGTSSVTYK